MGQSLSFLLTCSCFQFCSSIFNKIQINKQQISTKDYIYHQLIQNNQKKIMKYLKNTQKQQLTKPINFRGDTLLHFACRMNNVKMAAYIISKNLSSINQINNMNYKPYQIKKQNQTCRLVKKIFQDNQKKTSLDKYVLCQSAKRMIIVHNNTNNTYCNNLSKQPFQNIEYV